MTPTYQSDASAPASGAQLQLNPAGATPPTEAYVSTSDSLVIQIWNRNASAIVQVSWRLLLPDGTLSLNTQTITPTSDRVQNLTVIPMTEGFLISVTARLNSGILSGQTFVALRVRSGGSSSPTTVAFLGSGYVSNQYSLAWPGNTYSDGTGGPGALISVTGSTPAAGAEISETVPAHAMWRLIAFRYSLTTSATAATRQSDLLIDDGTNSLAELVPLSTQAATLTQVYNCMDSVQAGAVANGIITVPLPNQLILLAGYRIRTHSFNLQAGDQYTAPQYLVQEWIVN